MTTQFLDAQHLQLKKSTSDLNFIEEAQDYDYKIKNYRKIRNNCCGLRNRSSRIYFEQLIGDIK